MSIDRFQPATAEGSIEEGQGKFEESVDGGCCYLVIPGRRREGKKDTYYSK